MKPGKGEDQDFQNGYKKFIFSNLSRRVKNVGVEVKCKHESPGKEEMVSAWRNLSRHQRGSEFVQKERDVQRAGTSQ